MPALARVGDSATLNRMSSDLDRLGHFHDTGCMTSKLDTTKNGKRDTSPRERAKIRAYTIEFVLAMVAYVVILVAVMTWADIEGDSPWRFAWALLPIVPIIWVVVAVVRHLNRIDEYQRGRLVNGLAVGFAVAMLASITVGMLGIAGLAMEGAGWIIYSAGMLGWLVASLFGRKA